MNEQLDQRARAYLDEIAAEIVAHGNPEGDIAEEMKAAHQRRTAFAAEMRDGLSVRAKQARKLLTHCVHEDVRRQSATDRLMFDCAEAAA